MRRTAIAALLFTTAIAPAANASPEDVIGFGARSIGMGSTGPAIANGYDAVYANPALLSDVHTRELTLGYATASFDLRAGGPLSYDALHGSVIGATVPVPFGGALKDRVTLGLGFFTPFDLVVRGKILYPETPQFPIADRTQSVAVQAGVGLDLGYGLRIGAGFAALAALAGDVEVATDTSGRIGTTTEDSLVASYGPIFGASFDPSSDVRLGLTYRGQLEGRFHVTIHVKDLGDIVVPPLNIAGVAQFDPWQVSFEAAKHKGPVRFAVGGTFKHWSSYPGEAEATVECPLVDPTTGAQVAECNPLTPAPTNYRDTLSFHAGVEGVVEAPHVAMAFRAGTFFEPTPAPEQASLQSNVFDCDRVALSLGYGLSLSSPLPSIDLDLAVQAQRLLGRDNRKPDGTDVVASGTILAFATTAGVKF